MCNIHTAAHKIYNTEKIVHYTEVFSFSFLLSHVRLLLFITLPKLVHVIKMPGRKERTVVQYAWKTERLYQVICCVCSVLKIDF